ncbi:MAG: gamma carbonic anhydrase family protein [Rhodospirillales bacterium]|jgi:gamma-carbonic anhydrase|nr:gamma carbonic anhydrase family protein [Rhodospirillales bacterium]
MTQNTPPNPKWPGLILPYNGKMPKIHETAFIAPNAVIIGDVEIGAHSSVWFNCMIRGDMNKIIIGENTNIQDGTIIHIDSRSCGTTIGDNVTVGHLCLLHACSLKDNCMIGMNATVMDKAVVESGALVAAGALVAPGKHVGEGELWAGSPARKLRATGDKEQSMLDYIWPTYVKLSQDYVDAGQDLRSINADDLE